MIKEFVKPFFGVKDFYLNVVQRFVFDELDFAMSHYER
jgi:hypothetical protein